MVNPIYPMLCMVAVTLHVSEPYPAPNKANDYGLATCSGVFISPNEILTANHCVEHSRGRQWIKTDEGKSYEVEIEKKNKDFDLALLRVVKPLNHNYAVMGKPVNITEHVYTVNSGDDFPKTFNEGTVCNIMYDPTQGMSILHSAAIYGGASGSGLFNGQGQLIGINTARMANLSEAVDYYTIVTFLNKR